MKAWTLETENNEEKVQKEGRKKEVPKCVSLFSVSRNTRGQATYKQKSFIYFTGLNVHAKTSVEHVAKAFLLSPAIVQACRRQKQAC